jgi:phosphotransacetylase
VAVIEGFSATVMEGVRRYLRHYGGRVALVGDRTAIEEAAASIGWRLRETKQLQLVESQGEVDELLDLALTMLKSGRADGLVAGAAYDSSDVLRSAIRHCREPGGWVSEGVVLATPSGRLVAFGDCAVTPHPTVQQLARIAVDLARVYERLVGEEPRVAMLSYLTTRNHVDGQRSAEASATRLALRDSPTLRIEGPLQFDAAFEPRIARIKCSGSAVAGQANVFVFPDLAAANIGYKIAESVGSAEVACVYSAGVSPPIINLSRGATSPLVARTLAACALLSATDPSRPDVGTKPGRARERLHV